MTILNIYELHEQIGKGGFGTVYRATDTSLGRTVALKVLHPQMAWDADFIQRFQREARLAAQLENPYVVTIYGVGEDQGRYFIAMRYYPGGSLADLQKKGPLPWDKCVSILGQVCEGLQQLHQQGWVHRDMKPSNILFDPQGRAVVADFGLARVLTSSTSSSGGVAGTPHYKAPELWRGKPPASPATDVYALGCILGEILSGQILFSGETPDEVMTKHVLEGPEFGTLWPPPDLPDGVSAFIQRCLSKNPADRPADAAAFERELREFTTNIALPTKEAPAAFHSAVTASMPAADLSPAKAANQRQSAPPSNPPIHAPAPTVQYQPSAATLHPPLKKEQPGPKKSRLPGRIWPMLAMLGIGLVVGILMLIRALSNNPPEPDPVGAVSDAPTSAAVLQPGQAPSATSPTETAAALVNCTQAGQTRTSTQDGMTQVCVPAGEFEMGSDPRIDPYAQMDERPQHQVYLDSYWIDQTEVSNAAYARCVADGECTAPYKNSFILQSSYFEDSQFANYPVIFVNWNQAKEFCQWAGRRLPTEAEWEKAAREYSPRIYPWGNFPPNINLSNYNGVVGDTLPVDSFPQGASPYGVLNMAGNVWEWVSDWYAEGYYQNSPTRNPTGPQIGENRVLRGGAWNDESTSIRAANRNQYSPDGRNKSIGFRCAQSANTP